AGDPTGSGILWCRVHDRPGTRGRATGHDVDLRRGGDPCGCRTAARRDGGHVAADRDLRAGARLRPDLNVEPGGRRATAVSRPLYQLKAEFFKTLGHPVRIRVLELLSERDHAVSELLAAIKIEP